KTTRPGGILRKEDATVAKNYLTDDELQVLNRIVNLYIDRQMGNFRETLRGACGLEPSYRNRSGI
ncbi:MAG: RhuM family protein, partial [Planctomycetota bacterium]